MAPYGSLAGSLPLILARYKQYKFVNRADQILLALIVHVGVAHQKFNLADVSIL